MHRALSWFFVLLAGAGLAVTLFWFDIARGPEYAREHPAALIGAFLLVCAATLVNIGLRWARWHFLLRRFELRIETRESLRIYLATLPAIATPFYVGELVRAPLLAARDGAAWRAVPLVWFTERLTDAALLGTLVLFAFDREAWSAAALLSWLAAVLVLPSLHRPAARMRRPPAVAVLLACTALAWLLPVAALWATLRLLAEPLTLVAVGGAFAYGTVLGGLAGIPLGTGVTGSAMILALEDAGLATQVAVVVTAVVRGGTAWFAVALGVAAFVRSRRQLLAPFRADAAEHFDAIAQGYADQIPEHIRDRLLHRKVALMRRYLAVSSVPPGARGLDVGCGHGWYAVEMARAGFVISAFDQSPDQIAEARSYSEVCAVAVEFAVLDATRLPYPDAAFDFAYSINVLHHIEAPPARADALREIRRVLRPGAPFFLHEINTENPLFRLYMGYLFPLLCDIDEGTERWIRPRALPPVEGARWHPHVDYFTFLPDFTPRRVLQVLRPLEAWLERSPLRHWSAHYMARLVKDPDADHHVTRTAAMEPDVPAPLPEVAGPTQRG